METLLEFSNLLLTTVFVVGIAWGLGSYRRHVDRRVRHRIVHSRETD